MYDKGKIIFGIGVFVVLVASPWWYRVALGTSGKPPELEAPKQMSTDVADCVLPKAEMRGKHMELLNQWRNEFVREGKVQVKGADGKVVKWKDGKIMLKSLSNTCLTCHVNKSNFCDRCHSYAGADPYCWDCHVVPTGE